MTVEIWAEAALFLEKEYIYGIFVAVLDNADIVLITLCHRKQKDTGSRRDTGSSWTKGLRARDLRTAKELKTLLKLHLFNSHCLNILRRWSILFCWIFIRFVFDMNRIYVFCYVRI
jgi:hypothetical protein